MKVLLYLCSACLISCSQLPTMESQQFPVVMTSPQTASQDFTFQGKRYRLAGQWKVRAVGKKAIGESTVIVCETSATVHFLPPDGGPGRRVSPTSRANHSFNVHYLPEVEGGVLKMAESGGSAGGASGIDQYLLTAAIAVEPLSNATANGEMPVKATARLSVEDATASGLPSLAEFAVTTSWLAKPDAQGHVQLLQRGTSVR